jgi:hypothetical protein
VVKKDKRAVGQGLFLANVMKKKTKKHLLYYLSGFRVTTLSMIQNREIAVMIRTARSKRSITLTSTTRVKKMKRSKRILSIQTKLPIKCH